MVTEAFIGGRYVRTCPFCYAKDIHRMTGRRWIPQGEIASFMMEEAKRTLIK